MASELSLNYSISYHLTLDLELAKDYYREDWEASEDEADFEEWLMDVALANLRTWELRKDYDINLPAFISKFSISESLA